jgi:hypothetical protein
MTWADPDAPDESPTGEVIERSDGEVGYIAEMPLEVEPVPATHLAEVTDDQSTYAEDGSLIEEKSETILVEVLDEPDVELEKAKKPADHTHPHAHEHDHDHTHWNGIQHSHDHAHTHAHSHDDSHEHVDDKQGSSTTTATRTATATTSIPTTSPPRASIPT